MKYVLFREDSNTHREVFLAAIEKGKPLPCAEPQLALAFPSARSAYAFGAEHGLDWWRVGRR
jgi:hypothetical protein